jgi:hypothetical protein
MRRAEIELVVGCCVFHEIQYGLDDGIRSYLGKDLWPPPVASPHVGDVI